MRDFFSNFALTVLIVASVNGGVDPGCGGNEAGSVLLGAPTYCSTPYPSGLPRRNCSTAAYRRESCSVACVQNSRLMHNAIAVEAASLALQLEGTAHIIVVVANACQETCASQIAEQQSYKCLPKGHLRRRPHPVDADRLVRLQQQVIPASAPRITDS